MDSFGKGPVVSKNMKPVYWVALFVVFTAGGAYAQQGHEAICRPSKEVTLAFTMHGQVADVKVAVGDHVTVDQLLVQLDDAVEQAQVEQLKARAEDKTYIEAEEARLAQSQVDLKRLDDAAVKIPGSVTEYELDQAALQVTIGELSVKLAELNHDQDVQKYDEAMLQLERMQLTSPIEGTVEVLFVESGETVEALQQVIHLVNIDPLWIDIPVPIAEARDLVAGGSAEITFGGEADVQASGRIIHVASVADSASETLKVRVEMANPDHLPAGQQVFVAFPAPAAQAPEASDEHTDIELDTAQASDADSEAVAPPAVAQVEDH
jgi:RND family efflux transporter MFP subunit